VAITAQATVKSTTFRPVAAWQGRLEAMGATVQVTSETVLKGTVSLTMTVDVPQKGEK
jgi:predicted amino acid-binding ACT domain protein